MGERSGSSPKKVGVLNFISHCRRPARRSFRMASDPIVYVIDDDDGARHSLEFLLDCAGIRVRGFASADAFLTASPALDGAYIVTDVRMPGTNGMELVEKIRERKSTRMNSSHQCASRMP